MHVPPVITHVHSVDAVQLNLETSCTIQGYKLWLCTVQGNVGNDLKPRIAKKESLQYYF